MAHCSSPSYLCPSLTPPSPNRLVLAGQTTTTTTSSSRHHIPMNSTRPHPSSQRHNNPSSQGHPSPQRQNQGSRCHTVTMLPSAPPSAPYNVIPLSLTPAAASSHVAPTQASLRVAYQGVPGAYSEMAANKAYPDCSPVPCNQFDDAFLAVEQWLVDRAVLPIENSLGGSIHRNYDLLLRHRLHIVGEVQLPVNHCLLALPGSTIHSLTRVMSHPQALAQVEMTLSRLGTMTREAVDDTAGAAKMVSHEKLEGVGAVASSRAAQIYGLDILAEGIQDDPDNITRFLVLSREPIVPTNNMPFKTSIVFTLERGPGVLFKALSVFALRDINLTKIESRPQRDKPLLQQQVRGQQQKSQQQQSAPENVLEPSNSFLIDGLLSSSANTSTGRTPDDEISLDSATPAAASSACQMFDYLFYIDFQASLAERRAQNALRHLQEFAPFLRVLGSYPMDTGIQLDS